MLLTKIGSMAIVASSRRGVAQPGSASALGAEGREFESHRPDHVFLATRVCKVSRSASDGKNINPKRFAVCARSSTGQSTGLLSRGL